MNFKRNCLLIIALVGAVFTVAGCSKSDAFVVYEPIEEVEDTGEIIGFDGRYVKPKEYASYSAYDGNKTGEDKMVSLGNTYKVLTEYTGRHILEATGDKKLLVVPVEFEDYTHQTLGVSSEEYTLNLKKAFFGGVKNNKYVSVAEYYNRSSYGKLRITGKVCDEFFTFPKRVEEINTQNTIPNYVQKQYDKVLNWYAENYDDLEDYRDAVTGEVPLYLVYTLPTDLKTSNQKFFWAYTFNDVPLSWSSYSVMNTLAGSPDAHTFIHEVGHLFGLVDYYPTAESDASNPVPEPAGRIDMMDCSVGDHTALSKMWLNWARPYHVKDSCEISIKALVDAGDLILINDSWNGTIFDEYYLIEFYAPTGLNYFDTNIGNNYAKLPTLPGIKIYHVDARIGYYLVDSLGVKTFSKKYCYEAQGATPEEKFSPNTVTKNIDIVHDNTSSTKASEEQTHLKNYLYELQLNHVGHPVAGCAENINLYRTNDEFENFAFNSNHLLSHPKYKITVSNMTYRDATIKIEKKV